MDVNSVTDKPEPRFPVIQERKGRCTSADFGRERFFARTLLQASSDEFLNHKDISLLHRIDRLDNIFMQMKLTAMEDKISLEPRVDSFRSLNGSRRISPSALEKRCKSTESVLEEVEEKGTLVERVSELEKRFTKLQEMITAKLKDNVALHPIPSYNRSSHNNEHDPSQYDVDVEKHEVTSGSSAHLELPDYEQHHELPFSHSEKYDISPRKEDSSKHIEGQQGMASTEGVAMEKEDSRALQKLKKRNQIRNWLLKRMHKGLNSQQGKHIRSTGHCWRSPKSPQSCWNIRRGDPHASADSAHYARHSLDENSP